MGAGSVRKLLARAKSATGRLVLLNVKAPELDLPALKLFAEKTGYGRGIVIYAVSSDFRRKNLAERNKLVWQLLDRELTDRELEEISHLFTFAPKEFKGSIRKAVAVH